MKYKIMTKDEQWTMVANLTENEVIKYWHKNISGNVSCLDRIIQSEDGKHTYEIVDGNHLADCIAKKISI